MKLLPYLALFVLLSSVLIPLVVNTVSAGPEDILWSDARHTEQFLHLFLKAV